MQPKVFLSYSWKNMAIADTIDKDWQAVGITLTRDIRDLSFKDNIRDFMQRVRESDFVLLLISKDYLESKNCMYEALELLADKAFKHKILPILLNDANLHNAINRVRYIKYWDEQIQPLNEIIKSVATPVGLDSVIAELTHFNKIRNSIDTFANELQSILCVSWPQIKQDNYADIFRYIGYSQEEVAVLEECSRIVNIDASEEREQALEKLTLKHKETAAIKFAQFTVARQEGDYNKARTILEEIIDLAPDSWLAHHNLGSLLYEQFKEYKEARYNYERANAINPSSAETCYQLATLEAEQFQNYDQAHDYRDQGRSINPAHDAEYPTLASLLSSHPRSSSGFNSRM